MSELPLCLHCGVTRVKYAYNRRAGGDKKPVRYCSQACYKASADHARTTSTMAKRVQYRKRRARFADILQRIPTRCTREDLAEALAAAYRMGVVACEQKWYQRGFTWQARVQRKETAA